MSEKYYSEHDPRVGEVYEATIRNVRVGKAVFSLTIPVRRKLERTPLLRENNQPVCYRFNQCILRGNQYLRTINVKQAVQLRLTKEQSKLVDKILRNKNL